MSENRYQVIKNALILLKQRRAQFEQWEENCAAERRQGYRPSQCVHGTNQWTDYDNICGPCEDGLGWWDFQAQARDCLDMAHSIEHRVEERRAVILKITEIDRHSSRADRFNDFGALLDWTLAPREVLK